MKCLNPVRMYRTDNGIITHSPNGVKVADLLSRQCGYCINCRLYKAQSWAIKMCHETQFHEQNSFLTLTYAEEHLPKNCSLHFPDTVNFIKRIRRRLDRTPYRNNVSYYNAGEYGSALNRPHHHIILFGYDFSDPILYKGVRNTRTLSSKTDDRQYFKSNFATDAWDKGFVDVGNVDFATCMYAAKYVTKKLTGKNAYGDLFPEKATMSKGFSYPKFIRGTDTPHPKHGLKSSFPIGIRWIQKYYRDVYPHDFVMYNGKKYQPPRSYDEWLSVHQPRLWSLTKQNRENSMKEVFHDVQSLHAAHLIQVKKQSMFKRDGCAPNLLSDNESIARKLQLIYDQKEML